MTEIKIPMIEPGPLPAYVGSEVVEMSDGMTFIQLTISTCGGTNFAFMPAEVAELIGQGLIEKAQMAKNGGVVIPSPEVVRRIKNANGK